MFFSEKSSHFSPAARAPNFDAASLAPCEKNCLRAQVCARCATHVQTRRGSSEKGCSKATRSAALVIFRTSLIHTTRFHGIFFIFEIFRQVSIRKREYVGEDAKTNDEGSINLERDQQIYNLTHNPKCRLRYAALQLAGPLSPPSTTPNTLGLCALHLILA